MGKRKKAYTIFTVSKGNGKIRTIYTVDDKTKHLLQKKLPYLEKTLKSLDKVNANYAFTKGKNCVQHALQHIGYKYTLSMDLENFFDTVTVAHIDGLLDRNIIEECFIDGAPRQGLPTSPLIATIAFLKCDELISRTIKDNNIGAIYTRYADDLVFSFNNKPDSGKIKFIVSQIVESCGFTVNQAKTKLQDIRNGRIIITGVAIDSNGLYPTRKIRKKIRASIHQGNEASTRGLEEWAKCKLPKLGEKNE